MLNRLKGTPYLLLYDFGEMLTLDILLNEFPNNSLRVVFPELPVIAIIFVSIFFLNILELSVKNFRESFILTCREILFLLGLFTIANDAFFFKA